MAPTGISLQSEAPKDIVSLAPDTAFQDVQKQSLGAVAVLDLATNAILVQPDFPVLDGLENLKTHQLGSKADANTWRTDVRSTLFSVNDAIINYNTEFSSIYQYLYDFAVQLADPAKCADAQSNLLTGLRDLQQTMAVQKLKVDSAAKKIDDLRSSMTKHESDLKGDMIEIAAKFEGDKGKIEDLKHRITACNDAMRHDLTIVAVGATGIVVGILTTAVGVALWVESVGGSTPVIVVGIGMMLGGGGAMGYAIYDYNKNSDEKASTVRELATIKAEIAVATSLHSGVETLVQHLDVASDALLKLSGAWDQLGRDYQNIIEALQNTQGNVEKTTPLSFLVRANLEA